MRVTKTQGLTTGRPGAALIYSGVADAETLLQAGRGGGQRGAGGRTNCANIPLRWRGARQHDRAQTNKYTILS